MAAAAAATAGQVVHVVWFKFKADASKEAIDAFMNACLGLRATIPVVLAATVGKNFTERAGGASLRRGLCTMAGCRDGGVVSCPAA